MNRPRTIRHTGRQRGAAVISALIIVAIVAALTTSLFQRQTASTRLVENELARVQARWLLLGGMDWARLMLKEHSRRESTTRGDQVWATPVLDTRIERRDDARTAIFSGNIQDEQGKFNLYNLANYGVAAPDQEQILRRILLALKLPAALAPQMVEMIASAQAPAPAANTPGTMPTAGAPAQAPMPRGIDDVAARLSVDETQRAALRRCLTVLPVATNVNVNTAAPEVLAAIAPGLTLAQARSMTGERDRGNWFVHNGDFANRLTAAGVKAPAPAVTTASAWFMARGTVVYERAQVSLQALIRSAQPAAPETIWIRETP